MIQAITVTAVTLLVAAVFVSVVAEPSDAYEADPTISDSGFIKDKTAAFYYSKFATSGFLYSISKGSRSISADTLTAGVGKVFQENTVFASISKLDKDAQYYLAIEEHDKSGALNYGVIATLKSSIVTTYVFMSVNDGKPYSEADALTVAAMSGCANTAFTTEVTDDIYYSFRLTSDKDALAEDLFDAEVKNPLQFSKICYLEKKVNFVDDEVSNIGKNYGYTGSDGKSQYAGNALAYESGTYLCCFFVTNVSKEKLEINVDASSKFTLSNDSIHYGENVTSGYGYFVLSQQDYPEADFDKASVTIGEDGKAYASESLDTGSDDKKDNHGLIMVIGLAVVFIAAILIAMAYKGGHKEE